MTRFSSPLGPLATIQRAGPPADEHQPKTNAVNTAYTLHLVAVTRTADQSYSILYTLDGFVGNEEAGKKLLNSCVSRSKQGC